MATSSAVARRPPGAWVLILLLVFLGINGLFGGTAFLLDPSGGLLMIPREALDALPVPDFFLPGLFLFTVMGLFPFLVAYGLWRRPQWAWAEVIGRWSRRHWSWTATLALGIVIVLWIGLQVLLFGSVWPPMVMTLLVGLALLALVLTPPVRQFYKETSP